MFGSMKIIKNYFYTCYYLGKKVGYIRGEKKEETIIISIALLKIPKKILPQNVLNILKKIKKIIYF